jgi:DNA-binding PadR family transcriptional regulator
MDMEQLAEFEALFGHRHEALALLALRADGPMRWTDVGLSMSRIARERVLDKNVTRALHGLQRRGLVETVEADDGSQLYALTNRGTGRADRIADIFARLDRHQHAGPGVETPPGKAGPG